MKKTKPSKLDVSDHLTTDFKKSINEMLTDVYSIGYLQCSIRRGFVGLVLAFVLFLGPMFKPDLGFNSFEGWLMGMGLGNFLVWGYDSFTSQSKIPKHLLLDVDE